MSEWPALWWTAQFILWSKQGHCFGYFSSKKILKMLKVYLFTFKKKFFHQFLSELLTESRVQRRCSFYPHLRGQNVGWGINICHPCDFYLIWAPIGGGSRGDLNLSSLAKMTLCSQVLGPQRANCSMEVRVNSYLSSTNELGLWAHRSHQLTWHSEQWAPIPASPQTCQEKQPVNVSEAGQIQCNYQNGPWKMLRSYRRKRG